MQNELCESGSNRVCYHTQTIFQLLIGYKNNNNSPVVSQNSAPLVLRKKWQYLSKTLEKLFCYLNLETDQVKQWRWKTTRCDGEGMKGDTPAQKHRSRKWLCSLTLFQTSFWVEWMDLHPGCFPEFSKEKEPEQAKRDQSTQKNKAVLWKHIKVSLSL